MPRASATLAIVLAVYMPPQAPSPGTMAHSMLLERLPRSWCRPCTAPTPSKESMIVTFFSVPSLSFTQPGMTEPA